MTAGLTSPPVPSQHDTIAHSQTVQQQQQQQQVSPFPPSTFAATPTPSAHHSPNPTRVHVSHSESVPISAATRSDVRQSQQTTVSSSPHHKAATFHGSESQPPARDTKVFEQSLVHRRHLALPSESDQKAKLSDAGKMMSPAPQRYLLARVSAARPQQPLHQLTPQAQMQTYFHGYAAPVYGAATPVVPLAATPQVSTNPRRQLRHRLHLLCSVLTCSSSLTVLTCGYSLLYSID